MPALQNANATAHRLLSARHPNEESVRHRLASLLESLGYDIEPEYAVPDGGRMDIFLPQRRVVVEAESLLKP